MRPYRVAVGTETGRGLSTSTHRTASAPSALGEHKENAGALPSSRVLSSRQKGMEAEIIIYPDCQTSKQGSERGSTLLPG